jgi:3-hydroxy-9,10-secoandrosta-1,3,5(10)-triene-9,17-dione monooxygenase
MTPEMRTGTNQAVNKLPTTVPLNSRDADDYRALLERAWALVPLLRERAGEAEKQRRLTEDVVKAVTEAGLLRILRPRSVGGYALPAMIFYDVCSILARGCASTAWVVANLSSKEMMLALWPKAGQDEVWGAAGEKGDTPMAASYVFPAGRAERVPGGYRLSGRWPFCSGVFHSQWSMLGAMVKSGDGPAAKRLFLLPASQYTVVDNWHVTGLKATGSVDVAASDVFVPEHMTLADDDCHSLRAPGLAHHAAPIFRFPIAASAPYILVAVVYGAACMALEEFVASVKERVARSSGGNMAEFGALQARIAEAAACLDAADLLSRRSLDDTMLHIADHLDPPEKLPEERAARARRDAAFAAQLCVRAVDLVFASGGGTALFESSPIERAWRDVHAGVAQITLQWDIAGPAWGRVALGLPSGLPGV